MSAPHTLRHLPVGSSGQVQAIHAPEALGQRLLALGFKVGGMVQVIRRAAFSGPLHVRLGTTDLIIRSQDAAFIELRSEAA